jgi:hypothetical protein
MEVMQENLKSMVTGIPYYHPRSKREGNYVHNKNVGNKLLTCNEPRVHELFYELNQCETL